jgi:hypothetical protein
MRSIPILSPATTVPQEHVVLCRAYGAAQERCSRVMAQQQVQVNRLEREVLRLRAAVMVRDTALAIERERSCAARAMQSYAVAVEPMPARRAMLARLRTWLWLRPWGRQSDGAQNPVAGARRSQLAAADLLVGQGGWLSPGVDWPG